MHQYVITNITIVMESVNHYFRMVDCSSFNSSPTSWLEKQTLGEKGESNGFYNCLS